MLFDLEVFDLQVGDVVHGNLKTDVDGPNFFACHGYIGGLLQGDFGHECLLCVALEFVYRPLDVLAFGVLIDLRVHLLIQHSLPKLVVDVRRQLRERKLDVHKRGRDFLGVARFYLQRHFKFVVARLLDEGEHLERHLEVVRHAVAHRDELAIWSHANASY